MAELERITLDAVYDLGTVNFLNDLSYIKDKAKEDKRIQEQWLAKRKGSSN